MKTIGIIGGLTWVSTIEYYRLINEMVNNKLGGAEAARIILYSVNFGDIKTLTEANDWEGLTKIISDAAKKVEQAGAECLLVGANTMHKIADAVQDAIQIPLIHIATETASEIKKKELKTVALLGTKYTMQLDFYKQKLLDQGISTLIPDKADIDYINTCIYQEMSKGIFLPERKQGFIRIINSLIEQGAEGVILGCTEIPILIKQEDFTIPVFDTTHIHSEAAVEFALA